MKRLVICALVCSVFVLGCPLPEKTMKLLSPYRNYPPALSHKFVPIEEGKIYTSKEPDREFLPWLLREKKIKTFVSLKGEFEDKESVKILAEHGAKLLIFRWNAHKIPPQNEISEIADIMRNQAFQPVHIFCRAGVDRTGFIRAYYRYFFQGWSDSEALEEFYSFGHFPNALDWYLKKIFVK